MRISPARNGTARRVRPRRKPRNLRDPEVTERQPGKDEFSVVLGGPLYQLFRKAHLSGDALELVRQRLLLIVALTWLPLLVLCLLQGTALGTVASVPFLRDIAAQARFLLVIPLLIGAELIVHQRLRFVASQFRQRRLVPRTRGRGSTKPSPRPSACATLS